MKVQWSQMNSYERTNAKEKVIGYMTGKCPHDSVEQEFQNAKSECIFHLRRQIEQIEAMDFEHAFPNSFKNS